MSEVPSADRKPCVSGNVLAGKRRARLRAVGALLVAFATLALVTHYVFRYGSALGIQAAHLLYVLLLVCVALALRAERRRWRRLEDERVSRKRGLHRFWSLPGKEETAAQARSEGPEPTMTSVAPSRRGRSPNRRPGAVLADAVVVYAIVGGCVLTAFYLLLRMID